MHLGEQGRGRALKAGWSVSPAPFLVYMDIDLSTGLDALLPLVSSVMSGHSEVAVGSRRAPGARVDRSAKREIISAGYNALLRLTLGVRVRDAQCGFKAISRTVAHELLPEIEDDAWFFDTELITARPTARSAGARDPRRLGRGSRLAGAAVVDGVGRPPRHRPPAATRTGPTDHEHRSSATPRRPTLPAAAARTSRPTATRS